MKRINYQLVLFTMMLAVCFSCGDEESESECGAAQDYELDVSRSLFSNPSEYYWGVSGGVRSYTYNYTVGNICTKQNPKVILYVSLAHSNNTLNHPFSISGGVYTCLGVQAHPVLMPPNIDQNTYTNETSPAEIGMNQCFSGMASATIYPFITISFNTLGSSQADSLQLMNEVVMVDAEVKYNSPK